MRNASPARERAPTVAFAIARRPASLVVRVAPAVAALAYPLLVWSGPALWQPLLALAFLPPAIALWAAVKLGPDPRQAPRVVALIAVAGPPLFSLLGGLLDFQHKLPLSSLGVWLPLFAVLAVVAARTPRRRPGEPPPVPVLRGDLETHARSRLAVAHGISAVTIIVFALAHLVNHASGIAGGHVHIAVMNALRTVYRSRFIEPILLAAIAVQLASGMALVARNLRRRTDLFGTLQMASGLYMAMFFASHLRAVLHARHRGGHTDWQWLVDSQVFTDTWGARLVPYYALAIFALAIHLASAIRTVAMGHGIRARWTWLFAAALTLAAITATLVFVGLARG